MPGPQGGCSGPALRLEVEVAVSHPRRVFPIVVSIVLSLGALLTLAVPASATSLVRRGIEALTLDSETIVQGSVVDIHSYWNASHTLILTDVRLRPSKFFKGEAVEDVILTVMGGTVGGTTTLILGGPELAPGREYVLFLSHGDLPGAPARLTVRDLCQGAFAVRKDRAFSAALGEPLLPDAQGLTDVPGGVEGLSLETLAQLIRGDR